MPFTIDNIADRSEAHQGREVARVVISDGPSERCLRLNVVDGASDADVLALAQAECDRINAEAAVTPYERKVVEIGETIALLNSQIDEAILLSDTAAPQGLDKAAEVARLEVAVQEITDKAKGALN